MESLNLNDRATLARLFWSSRAMDVFATGQHLVRSMVYQKRDPSEISSVFFGDEAVSIDVSKVPVVQFELRAVHLGRETWVAVVSNGMVIVPPFPFTSYEALPRYPEDIPDV